MVTRFVILGCGHTGTSLLSGIFHTSGFGSLNEDGLFEPKPLVALNQKLLNDGEKEEMYEEYKNFFELLEQRRNGKWCIKDPRLTLTIHTIYELIPKPFKVLYNIRNPRNTVTHLLKEYSIVFPEMSESEALRRSENQWYERNSSVLRFLHEYPEIEYLVVNYDDLVDGRLNDVIDRFVGKRMNYHIINSGRRKSPPIDISSQLITLQDEIMSLYRTRLTECILGTKAMRSSVLESFYSKIAYRRYFYSKRLSRG